MSNFEKMAIPIEADGITDDREAFKKQQTDNAKALKQEINDSYSDDLAIGDYEDINGSPVKKHEYSKVALDKVLARKIGRHALLGRR